MFTPELSSSMRRPSTSSAHCGDAAVLNRFPLPARSPRLRAQTPVLDVLGGVPIVLVVGDDQKSIRVFERTLDGKTLELMAKAGAQPLRLLDAETGSEWDFSGRAVSGPLAGRQLTKVKALKEYWFDWQIYQPGTTVYARGATLSR